MERKITVNLSPQAAVGALEFLAGELIALAELDILFSHNIPAYHALNKSKKGKKLDAIALVNFNSTIVKNYLLKSF